MSSAKTAQQGTHHRGLSLSLRSKGKDSQGQEDSNRTDLGTEKNDGDALKKKNTV